ncbi:hypothetical protein RBB50_011466 [Rhinocladiella similis]
MASFVSTLIVVVVAFLLHASHGYVDFGDATLPLNEPLLIPTPRPNQLPIDHDLRFEILPSMITAVAPSITIAPNGTRETIYSLHYHHYFSKTREGRGLFKRGVFAGDPPVSTCTPCGGAASSGSPAGTTSSILSCTTHTYLGVFRSPDPQTPKSVCLNGNYSGALDPVSSSTTGLPCCFTIPASCLANGTSSTSFTATSGVFRPTSTSSVLYANMTTTASTTSRFSQIVASSTSSSPFSSPSSSSFSMTLLSSSSNSGDPILNSASLSTTTRTIVTVITGTTVVITTSTASSMSLTPTILDSSSSASFPSTMPYVSGSSLLSTFITSSSTSVIYSIIVISSTTITLSNPETPTGSSVTTGSQPTLTVITATPTPIITTTSSSSASYVTTVVSNTIDGCGTGSGSGIVAGTGTIYTEGVSIVSSGTVSGSASSVVGCGYIIATTGTFIGSAIITGCGYGSGTGTLTGTGTIWPAQGMGMVSIVSSGTVSGSGSFRGCGTLTGSGAFTATEGYTTTILAPVTTSSAPSARPTKTVSVFVSYCAADSNNQQGNIIINIFGNNNTLMSPSVASNGSDMVSISNVGSADNALCNACPNSAGICCPPGVTCDEEDGKCPQHAVEKAGYTINGYLIPQVMNSSAPVEGQRRHMARVRVKSREEKERELRMDSKGVREDVKMEQRRRHGHGHGYGHSHGHGHDQEWEKKMKRKQF